MTEILLLLLAVLMSGVYGVGLKPANDRCRSMGELQLFNGCFTFIAAIASFARAALAGQMTIPVSGLLAAAFFGCIFSVCVFTNLKALEDGPVSLTTLIVNFSLVMPVAYSFLFLHEDITVFRVIGIGLLVVCMFLFTNPRVTGEKKLSLKWLGLTLFSLLCNGTLSVTSKIYAMKTDNLYGTPYLAYCYLFATVTSFLIFAFLDAKQPKEKRTHAKEFFTPAMLGIILLIGLSNFGLNSSVVYLATRMDGAVVYPVIQGGGPIISSIGSRLFFGEKIPPKKAAAILLGVAAIVLLNL